MDFKKKYWEDTYQRNIKKLIDICFRYVTEQQIAEDLAHDAFLTAMHKAGTYNGSEKMKLKHHLQLKKIVIGGVLSWVH